MASTDLAVRIATVMDASGLKKADKALGKFEKSASKLGRTLGVSLGSAALVAFGKKAVDAFAADERAATQLNMAIKNLGLSFASADITKFIAGLEKSASIADDKLRPAMQALLTTTGSVAKSQELLSLAIETSRGSGVDLATAAQDIANAYVGNTRGLRKYYLGLTQAELKTASFATVQAKLAEQFTGSNAAYLDTTAGKMEAISLAAGNAAETIGGSLVNALAALSGGSGASGFIKFVDSVASKISALIDETARFIFITKYAFNPKNIFKGGDAFDKALKEFNNKLAKSRLPAYDPSSNAVTGYKTNNAAMIKADKDAAKRAKMLADAQKKNTAELKKQAMAKKQSTLFDLEQIQIMAALKGNISKEERLRLELQLALITENTKEADKLSQQLANSIDQTGNLAKYLTTLPDANNPFKNWDAFLDSMIAKARAAAGIVGSVTGGAVVPQGNVPNSNPFPDTSASQAEINRERGNFYGSGNVGAQSVVVQIDGKAVASALLDQSMSAGQVAYLDRRTGGF